MIYIPNVGQHKLFPMHESTISVCGRHELNGLSEQGQVHTHIIQFNSTNENPFDLGIFPRTKVYKFMFDDVYEEESKYGIAPSPTQMEDLVELLKELMERSQNEKIDLLIHCHAGVARSTAAALGLLYMVQRKLGAINPEERSIEALKKLRPCARPNTLMLHLMHKHIGASENFAHKAWEGCKGE